MPVARPYTRDMVADRCQCSAETVRQLVKCGALRGFRIGRMVQIPADALEKYECGISESDGSRGASSSYGMMEENGGAIVFRQIRPTKPPEKPAKSS